MNNFCVPELSPLTQKETAALLTPNFHSGKIWGEVGKSGTALKLELEGSQFKPY